MFISVHSHFSLLYGTHSPYALCRRAKELGYSTVALTDRNNLYGLPEFLKACCQYSLRPIIGAEITTENESVFIYSHGRTGYANLCRIITEKHCNTTFAIPESLLKNPAGLYVVTDDIEIIKKLYLKLPVYYRIKSLRQLPVSIKTSKIPCLIIPDSVFIGSGDYAVHTLLRAIDQNTTLSRVRDSAHISGQAVMRSWDAIATHYGVWSEALGETERFAQVVQSHTEFGAAVMPEFPGRENAGVLLREKSFEGAARRYGLVDTTVADRLNYELDLICSKGFAGYFLVVDDIVKQSPRTCGRGSGAASCVAYCLGITNVDPIRYNLMFERFLNEGRRDPPDIDIDFAWDERDAILDYVFETYGNDHTAMVANHLTMQPRMALREVARVYGLTETEISAVTKRFPYFYAMGTHGVDIQEVLARHPRTRDLPLEDPWPEIIITAQKLIGIPRGIGTHCGGVVITPEPIWHHVPVQPTPKGYQVIHWEKDGAEDIGLVKIDLLGNRSLAVVRDAVRNVRGNGIPFDEKKWDPAGDLKTVALLASGKTMGVFYVESPAMRLLQQKTGHGDFGHLVIHSSIIRPAANKYIIEYIRRLKGGAYTPEHPLLGTVLAETYGIMVYQEDVAKVAMALAGFSAAEADSLRKIMSKKDRYAKLNDFREKFFAGASARGVGHEAVSKIWEMCLSFTGYSFCKPHSASYVQVSFQSAYLKAHYPAAMLAAVMSNYGGFYTTQAYVSEAVRCGITILPPDVNASEEQYRARDMQIRVGLCQIRGLSVSGRKTIVAERHDGGLYRSLNDLLQRTGLAEHDAEQLIYAGACDRLDAAKNRSQYFWQMRCFFRTRGDGTPPALKQYTMRDLLRSEYRMLGFLTVCHPITLIPKKNEHRAVKISTIDRYVGKAVMFYGWCVTSRTTMTKNNDSMQFVTFEDETGIVETVLFPEAYTRYIHCLMHQEAFCVSGMVMQEFGAVTVNIISVENV